MNLSELYPISGCDNADRNADVVFIHGLGGDATTTWRFGDDESTSWPHWLAKDFPQVGVWALGYAASPTSWTRFLPKLLANLRIGSRDSGHAMALPDRGLQVLDLMVQRGVGARPLLFICHSLGGLLVKQILRKSHDSLDPRKQQLARATRAVLFLATPHAGASLASLADTFRSVFGTTVSIEDLRAHDAHLRDLFDWYRNRASPLGIQTETYYELRPVGQILTIVNPTSAHPGVGADPIGLDEDHLSISKPRGRHAQVYGAARDIIQNFLLSPSQNVPAPPISNRHVSTTEVKETGIGTVQSGTTVKLNRQADYVSGRSAAPVSRHDFSPDPDAQSDRTVEETRKSEELSKTMSNPYYASDLPKLDRTWLRSSVINIETIIIVVGTNIISELLDRSTAELLRDQIDHRGAPNPFRRGIIVTDEGWNLEANEISDNPVIAIGGPKTNKLTQIFDNLVPVPGKPDAKYRLPGPNERYGFFQFNARRLPQVGLWGFTAFDTREAVSHYINSRRGLSEFLRMCWKL